MYKTFLSAISASAILLSGCGAQDPELEPLADAAVTDTVPAAVQDVHAGHAMPGADSASADAVHDMTGMDHGSSATGTGDHAEHAAASAASTTDHSAHGSGSGHPPMTSTEAHAAHGGVLADGGAHSAHATASGSSDQTATIDHGRHQPSSPHDGQLSTDHALHPSQRAEEAAPPRSHVGHEAPTDQHAGHALTSPGGRAVDGANPAEDKLLTLVGALVQDSVVQRRIEQDSVLRALWRDPGVRRIVQARHD